MYRQARGSGRGVPAFPAHLDNDHVLRFGDSLVLFLLRLLGGFLLLMLIVDERPGTAADHGNGDNNARHDSGDLAGIFLLRCARTSARLIGKGLGRNRAATLARNRNGLGHERGFIDGYGTCHDGIRCHGAERLMGSSDVGTILLGIRIGLFKDKSARLGFCIRQRNLRFSLDFRATLRAKLGAICQRRTAIAADRIGLRIRH